MLVFGLKFGFLVFVVYSNRQRFLSLSSRFSGGLVGAGGAGGGPGTRSFVIRNSVGGVVPGEGDLVEFSLQDGVKAKTDLKGLSSMGEGGGRAGMGSGQARVHPIKEGQFGLT